MFHREVFDAISGPLFHLFIQGRNFLCQGFLGVPSASSVYQPGTMCLWPDLKYDRFV